MKKSKGQKEKPKYNLMMRINPVHWIGSLASFKKKNQKDEISQIKKNVGAYSFVYCNLSFFKFYC